MTDVTKLSDKPQDEMCPLCRKLHEIRRFELFGAQMQTCPNLQPNTMVDLDTREAFAIELRVIDLKEKP